MFRKEAVLAPFIVINKDSMSNYLIDSVLMPNEVHVWRASLQQPSNVILQLINILSNDERQRAERYHYSNLRRSYIVARGLLRLLLGYYVNLEPEQLKFEYTLTGKPFLSKQSNEAGICFNLSHSADHVIYAITKDKVVGIDIEHIRPLSELEEIATSTFSTVENNQLKTIPPSQKLEAFFNCWTRKEAFIKAIGEGISFPLDQFDVTLRPDEPARILKIRGSEEEAKNWFMHAFKPINGYVAALVVEGNNYSIKYHEWNHYEHVKNT